MDGLPIENLFARFGRANHVPVIPAKSDLVQLAIFVGPRGDLLMWLQAELMGISENGKTKWSRCMVSPRWRTLLVTGVECEGNEEAEKQENGVHVGQDNVEVLFF
jgi:hypothetical protein